MQSDLIWLQTLEFLHLSQEQELKLMSGKARIALCVLILGCSNQFAVQYNHTRLYNYMERKVSAQHQVEVGLKRYWRCRLGYTQGMLACLPYEAGMSLLGLKMQVGQKKTPGKIRWLRDFDWFCAFSQHFFAGIKSRRIRSPSLHWRREVCPLGSHEPCEYRCHNCGRSI